MKKQNGITLIALVITIIVLLILAGVSISMVTGDNGIASKATEAKEKTKTSQENEKNAMDDQLTKIDDALSQWSQSGIIIKKGSKTLTVGDVVDYDETKNGEITGLTNVTWKILGEENGQILLLSTSNISTLALNGKDGYLNGINELNNICSVYGKGENASSARSVTVEDINRVTGYDPMKGYYDSSDETYKAYGYGQNYEYDKSTIFNINRIYFKEAGFTQIDDENVVITSNYYSYFPTTLTSEDTNPEKGLKIDSEQYKLLFQDAEGEQADYWLANKFIRVIGDYINYGLRTNYEGEIQRDYLISGEDMNYSDEKDARGVRVVVKLDAEVNFEKDDETGVWNLK